MPRRVRRLREKRASIDRTSDTWARSFRQNEFVLCGQAQVIRVVAMKNDNVARADEQIAALDAVVHDGEAAFIARGAVMMRFRLSSFFFVPQFLHFAITYTPFNVFIAYTT